MLVRGPHRDEQDKDARLLTLQHARARLQTWWNAQPPEIHQELQGLDLEEVVAIDSGLVSSVADAERLPFMRILYQEQTSVNPYPKYGPA